MQFFKKFSKDNNHLTNTNLKKRLEAIVEVNKAMTGITNEDEILSLVTSRLVSLVGISFASVWKWEEEKNILTLKNINVPKAVSVLIEKFMGNTITNTFYDLNNPKHNKNLTVQTFKQGKLLQTKSLYDVSYPLISKRASVTLQKALGMKFAIHIPLIAADKKLGVLGLIWNEEQISNEDNELILSFSNQISTTIYNSFLFSKAQNQIIQLETKTEDLQSLFDLTSNVTKSLDTTKVCQTAVDSLPQKGELIGGIIQLHDKDTDDFMIMSVTENTISKSAGEVIGGFEKYNVKLAELSTESTLRKVLKSGKPESTDSLETCVSPPVPKNLIPPLVKLMNLKRVAVYPLKARSRTIGTIMYFIKQVPEKDANKNIEQLLKTYSLQIGIAIENALLYEQSQQIRKDLQTALDDIEEARRRERDMIDVMGHELRTPLSIVRNAIAVLSSDYKKHDGVVEKEKLGKYLEMSLESVRREMTLVESLLTSTKIEGNRIQLLLEKVDFVDVVVDSIEGNQQSAKQKKLKLIFNKPEKDVFVFADRVRIQEIMDNFLSNSIKYTAKGSVTIKISTDKDFARIDVIDTGVGISAEDLESLGKKFFRAKRMMRGDNATVQPSGTGLGLYVSFELINMMNGKKWITSTVGKGSTFSFAFPLYKGQKDKRIDQTFMEGG